ncbi:L-aspartate oxidase [Rugamonas apoptosis]|uniref:L-aspartate oxidase n=1 Tax=Rugamonas apoptosis TaxID=2758570 RepID=A0A7W2FEV2_9BURK|nr:L-aspartate oxidase [Rugamonas apoptosis]MBA5690309.1 L-aspartate oxidase [Rugamonas apoptosis]
MKFDLLVVGEGLAALTLLLNIPVSIKVGVISRNKFDEPSSYWAQGGISAVFSEEDDFDKHVKDTLAAGDGLCNEQVVRDIVSAGTSVLQWLIDMGVPFTRENNDIHLTREGGHSERRVAHVDDMTGRGIMQTLQAKVALLPNVTWIRQYEAVELISDGDRVTGLIAQSLSDGDVAVFNASNVVLAAGGITGLYPYATNPHASKGEAIAMAWRAGATVENLEFVQFHPTAFQVDQQVVSLITEAVRGEGGHLYNIANERFMAKYSSQEELAPRDIVARAIYSEMAAHQSPYVWLDISYKGRQFVEHHFPNLVELTRRYQRDMSSTRVPVSPAAHYTCGGIAADLHGQTSVAGLFAIGEVANCGLHGANRLASNSLLECVVMGKACAEALSGAIVTDSKQASIRLPAVIETRLSLSMLPALRATLWDHAGIVRSRDGIAAGLRQLETMQLAPSLLPYGQALRAQNIHDAAYLILHSASLRKESRGGHFNTDYRARTLPLPTIVNGVYKKCWHPSRRSGIQAEEFIPA